ncbi:DNA repair protein RecN [Candidatus Halobeggiatoa sp. HSG11]|nr:DNA repair protein RecN [Candidatus Halobeggiatoa sp. HSG11]
MLHYLKIENFAIVEQLELNFTNGLTIITGETGAGKSILIDALGLVLGDRADSNVVRYGSENAQIQATFTLPPTAILLQDNVIDNKYSVRRVVGSNGRSRAYINEQAVSVQTLRKLGEYLIDIHGQHAHQSLLKAENQRQLLDDTASDKKPLELVEQVYQQWKTIKNTLNGLGGEDREAKIALLRYQVQELEEFELTAESIANLENEYRRLANAQQLLENSQQALNLLDNDAGNSTLSCLCQANHTLQEVQEHDTKLINIITLLENAIIQTQEAVGELGHYAQSLDIDNSRLQEVQQQITSLQDLARKHRIRFIDLPKHFIALTEQLHELENYAENANHLQTKLTATQQEYQIAAEALHVQRIQTAQQLGDKITTEMHRLGMPGGRLVINVNKDNDSLPTSIGTDIVEFLVSTNPGHAPKPLQKVASGGELSRISLAIQVITAQTNGVPILVFDEVDVGIGGGVAEIVGHLLNNLSQQRQVLCITHLPQVACQGQQHLQVSKTIQQNSTHTAITVLNQQQRIEEIARMLGGIEITNQTLAHAEEMIQLTSDAISKVL